MARVIASDFVTCKKCGRRSGQVVTLETGMKTFCCALCHDMYIIRYARGRWWRFWQWLWNGSKETRAGMFGG